MGGSALGSRHLDEDVLADGEVVKFCDAWIGDSREPLLRLRMGEDEENDGYKVVWFDRESLHQRLGSLSVRGTSFESAITKMADAWQEAADEIRTFAPKSQAVMDSGEVSMSPIERAVANSIGQYIRDTLARGKRPQDDNEEMHALAYRIETGEWK